MSDSDNKQNTLDYRLCKCVAFLQRLSALCLLTEHVTERLKEVDERLTIIYKLLDYFNTLYWNDSDNYVEIFVLIYHIMGFDLGQHGYTFAVIYHDNGEITLQVLTSVQNTMYPLCEYKSIEGRNDGIFQAINFNNMRKWLLHYLYYYYKAKDIQNQQKEEQKLLRQFPMLESSIQNGQTQKVAELHKSLTEQKNQIQLICMSLCLTIIKNNNNPTLKQRPVLYDPQQEFEELRLMKTKLSDDKTNIDIEKFTYEKYRTATVKQLVIQSVIFFSDTKQQYSDPESAESAVIDIFKHCFPLPMPISQKAKPRRCVRSRKTGKFISYCVHEKETKTSMTSQAPLVIGSVFTNTGINLCDNCTKCLNSYDNAYLRTCFVYNYTGLPREVVKIIGKYMYFGLF